MLAFDVINLEQHRALHQNAVKVYLRDSHCPELSLSAWSPTACKLSKLNRQIPELKHRVTYRKQTAETCSNRQKFQKCSHPISESTSVSSARVLETSATRKMEPLATKNEAVLAKWAPTSNRKWRANRCYRKQIIKPCLTEARTRLRETAFSCNSQISAVALGDQFMLHSEAPERPSQSSNLARPYGRS
jgi:hypothetical protein